MANLIDITDSTLSQNIFYFDSRNIDNVLIPIPIDNAKFGILNFTAVTAKETSTILEFVFIIDCSGSMSDECSDGRTKMQHIIHTLKNMLLFFVENSSLNVYININTFDSQIYEIITHTKISKDNIDEIISKINVIRPNGSTDIEFALKDTFNLIKSLKNNFPSHSINHIFMTDGEATNGSNDVNVLSNFIDTDVSNIFIGFGISHDSVLLDGISSVRRGSYYFIDKLESSGLVYGEILHSIVYKLLTDVEIIVQNGLIYDFKNNIWCERLMIDDIISEANKTYNIASNVIENCEIQIKAKYGDLTVLYPSIKNDDELDNDLTIHMYRQRTLQLLYKVNNYIKKYREIKNNDNFPTSQIKNNQWFNTVRYGFNNNNSENIGFIEQYEQEKKLIKDELISYFNEIKKYINDNNLHNDKLLKNLCDDIYICYRTFETKYGGMYCNARQTSQGSQRTYSATHTQIDNLAEPILTDDLFNNIPNRIPRLHRTRNLQSQTQLMNLSYFSDNDNDIENQLTDHNFADIDQLAINVDDDIIPEILNLSHEVSNYDETPYLTPQVTRLMHIISNSDNFDDEISDCDSNLTRACY